MVEMNDTEKVSEKQKKQILTDNAPRKKANVDHLEYIAARKSWIAGRTAEGGQSVIKSVANFTTYKQTSGS